METKSLKKYFKAEIEIIGFNEDIVTASNYDDGEADPFDFKEGKKNG